MRYLSWIVIAVMTCGCVHQATYQDLAERQIQHNVYSWRIPTYYLGSDTRFDYFESHDRRYKVLRMPGVLEPRMPLPSQRDDWVEVVFDEQGVPQVAAEVLRQWHAAVDQRIAAISSEKIIELSEVDWWEVPEKHTFSESGSPAAEGVKD